MIRVRCVGIVLRAAVWVELGSEFLRRPDPRDRTGLGDERLTRKLYGEVDADITK